jgi:hypothetical protein
MQVDVVATLAHAIQPPLAFDSDIDVEAMRGDLRIAQFTIHLSVISLLSLEARSVSTPRIAPISSWPHKPHNLPQVLLALFAHQERQIPDIAIAKQRAKRSRVDSINDLIGIQDRGRCHHNLVLSSILFHHRVICLSIHMNSGGLLVLTGLRLPRFSCSASGQCP